MTQSLVKIWVNHLPINELMPDVLRKNRGSYVLPYLLSLSYSIYPIVAFHCYDCGFISAKTNDPDFGIEIDVVC